MKKILSILFLLVFVYNLAGFFIVFKCQQYSVKSDMKALLKKDIPDSKLDKIIIPDADINSGTSDFRYLDDNKEFFYNGKLYDIARSYDDGIKTVFYCINDMNEEQLYSKLEEHIQRNNDQNIPGKTQTASLLKGMIKDYFPQRPLIQFSNTGSEIFFHEQQQSLLKQFIPVFTPPPES
jgi:hypothetical protein